MRAFLLQHIDACITLAVGLWLTFYSWRHRERLRASPRKLTRALPILTAVVVISGLLQFAFDSKPAYPWHRAFTSDQRASAEFPCATTTETAADSAQGVSVQRLTVNCNVPRTDINLRLSFNEIPPEGEGFTIEQRLAGLKSFFEQRGFATTSCVPDGPGAIPSYRMVLEQERGKVRCVTRVAIGPKAIYRAIATSSSGFHDDPVITRFIDSFSLH